MAQKVHVREGAYLELCHWNGTKRRLAKKGTGEDEERGMVQPPLSWACAQARITEVTTAGRAWGRGNREGSPSPEEGLKCTRRRWGGAGAQEPS